MRLVVILDNILTEKMEREAMTGILCVNLIDATISNMNQDYKVTIDYKRYFKE